MADESNIFVLPDGVKKTIPPTGTNLNIPLTLAGECENEFSGSTGKNSQN